MKPDFWKMSEFVNEFVSAVLVYYNTKQCGPTSRCGGI